MRQLRNYQLNARMRMKLTVSLQPLAEVLDPFRASNQAKLFGVPAGDNDSAQWLPALLEQLRKATKQLVLSSSP